MIKRAVFYTFVLLLVSFGVYRVYQEYAPDVIEYIPETINYQISPLYNQNTIDDYLLNCEEDCFVMFYKSYGTNSIYVFNKIMSKILEEYQLESIDKLIFCNMDTLESTETETKNHWGFYQTPAFVRIKPEDNVLQIVSALEWSNTNSLSYDEVVSWMKTNELLPY